jgi:hypothetical protein
MKFLQIVRILLEMLPIIIQTIKAVEEAIPGQGKGEAKLALVRSALEAAYEISNDLDFSFETLWPQIKVIIDKTVSVFNTIGEFKKA